MFVENPSSPTSLSTILLSISWCYFKVYKCHSSKVHVWCFHMSLMTTTSPTSSGIPKWTVKENDSLNWTKPAVSLRLLCRYQGRRQTDTEHQISTAETSDWSDLHVLTLTTALMTWPFWVALCPLLPYESGVRRSRAVPIWRRLKAPHCASQRNHVSCRVHVLYSLGFLHVLVHYSQSAESLLNEQQDVGCMGASS